MSGSQAGNVICTLFDGAGKHLVEVGLVGADTSNRVPDDGIGLIGQVQITAGLYCTLFPKSEVS